jgi:hypothetical protein
MDEDQHPDAEDVKCSVALERKYRGVRRAQSRSGRNRGRTSNSPCAHLGVVDRRIIRAGSADSPALLREEERALARFLQTLPEGSSGMRSSAGEDPRHRNATASVVLPRLADGCFSPAMQEPSRPRPGHPPRYCFSTASADPSGPERSSRLRRPRDRFARNPIASRWPPGRSLRSLRTVGSRSS